MLLSTFKIGLRAKIMGEKKDSAFLNSFILELQVSEIEYRKKSVDDDFQSF